MQDGGEEKDCGLRGDDGPAGAKHGLEEVSIGGIYTVTLSIRHKVLLHASLQVPFGWLAELQLPSSRGKEYTPVATFRKTFHRTKVCDRQCHSVTVRIYNQRLNKPFP